MSLHSADFPTDITVSAIVCREQRFLCIEETTRHGVQINLPGGHIESGESAEQAVVREVMEESRWQFRPTGFVGAYLWLDLARRQRQIRLMFCGHVSNERCDAPLDDGIVSVHWRSRDELATESGRLRAPVVLSAIDDFLAGRRERLQLQGARQQDLLRRFDGASNPL